MFRYILLTFIITTSLLAQAFDTTRVLRYTEAVSEKMDFPSVMKRFNGDFMFSDEDMASFTVKAIKENYIQILKSGGMNDHLYTLKIFTGKKGKYLVAINFRSGSDGWCQIKCFSVTDHKDSVELTAYSKGLYTVKYEDFGIDKEMADVMRDHASLIYIGYTFHEEQEIKVDININPPFGKENQQVLEKISDAYPNLTETVFFLQWNRKKCKFIKP